MTCLYPVLLARAWYIGVYAQRAFVGVWPVAKMRTPKDISRLFLVCLLVFGMNNLLERHHPQCLLLPGLPHHGSWPLAC